MRIIIVRHGESEHNRIEKEVKIFCGASNTPLSEDGVKSAIELQENEYINCMDKIYSSPLSRAYDTACLATKNLNKEIIVDDRLRERSLGVFEGRLQEELEIEYPEYFKPEDNLSFRRDFVKKAPGGENYTEVSDRLKSFFDSLDLNENTTIGIFAHMHAIRCMLYLLLGISKEDILKLRIKNTEPIVVEGIALGQFKITSHKMEDILTYKN